MYIDRKGSGLPQSLSTGRLYGSLHQSGELANDICLLVLLRGCTLSLLRGAKSFLCLENTATIDNEASIA